MSNTDQKLPLGFLNQMFVLMKIIKVKLGNENEKLFEGLFESNEQVENRRVLESFFGVCDELIKSIEKYEFSLCVKSERKNLGQMIDLVQVKIDNGEIGDFDQFTKFVHKRKLDDVTIDVNNKKNKKL